MIKLLRKLLYRPTPVVELRPRAGRSFELYAQDDFGRRWRELIDNGELPRGLTEEKLIASLLSFHDASVQEREYELRHLTHYASVSEWRTLSSLWWGLVLGTPWVQLSRQRLPQLSQYYLDGYAILAYQNVRLVAGILALHLHLHQRDAMSQLPFFIVQCEEVIPRLGKASPFLAKIARRLQRSYGFLPRFRESSSNQLGGKLPTSTLRFDELAKLIGGEEADE